MSFNALRTTPVIGSVLAFSGQEYRPLTPGDDLIAEVAAQLGLAVGTDVQAWDQALQDISDLTPSADDLLVSDGSNWGTLAKATLEQVANKGAVDGYAGLDATGKVPLAQLPQTALERLSQVADQTARYALTTATVQNGDSVKQLDTGTMYVVVDDTQLNNANGYEEYTAGTAAAVPWSGITAMPAAIDAIDGLTPAADKLPYYTGASAAALTDLSSYGRSLIDDADAATARDTLGLGLLSQDSDRVIAAGTIQAYGLVNGDGTSIPAIAASQTVKRMGGITWTIRTSAADNDWYAVCWAPELRLFCAVANTGTSNRVMTSPDGITWTTRTSAADNDWYSVCWSSELGLFCAVAGTGTSDRVMTSPDGITWTSRTSAADNNWFSVCWSPELSLFCAVAASGTSNRVMTSPDGITWTSQTNAVDNGWISVCWSPELSIFCAVAITGTSDRVMTSPDGITWTTQTSAADNSWRSVCWSSELSLFCAVSYSGSGNRVMTSPDGITWTIRTSAADNSWRAVCWSPELGLFCAASASGTSNRAMTSTHEATVHIGGYSNGTITANIDGTDRPIPCTDDDITLASGKHLLPTDSTGQDLGDATHRWDLFAQNVDAAGYIAVGSTPATFGSIRIANNLAMYGRNAANTANINMISVLANDTVSIGYGGDEIAFGGHVTIADAKNIKTNTTTGSIIADATSQKLGFWGATPVVQPASANQAALGAVTTTGANTGTAGAGLSLIGDTSSADQSGPIMNDLRAVQEDLAALFTLVNQLRSDNVSVGLIKGSA